MNLTNAMRTWLGKYECRAYLYDVVQEFMTTFGLSPEQAAKCIGQWVIETA